MEYDLGNLWTRGDSNPDLTRASGAEVIYGYSQAFAFSATSAGQTAIAAHAYSHPLPPVSVGDVGDLLGADGGHRAGLGSPAL